MIKQLITGALVLFLVCVFAQIPAGYYDATSGRTDTSLKSAFNTIIDGLEEHLACTWFMFCLLKNNI